MLNVESPMLNKLALSFLKLEAKCLVPESTVQLVLDELADLHQLNAEFTSDSLSQKLKSVGIPNEIAQSLLRCVESEPLSMLLRRNGPLHSDHLHKTLYRKTLNFVPPIAISLGNNAGKEQKFHYVPIKSTLQALFQDPFIGDSLRLVANSSATDKLQDFCYGSIYKNHVSLRTILMLCKYFYTKMNSKWSILWVLPEVSIKCWVYTTHWEISFQQYIAELTHCNC